MRKNQKKRVTGLSERVDRSNKKTALLFFTVFLVSFLWMLSLTYNFNYYWEDEHYLRQYQDYINNPEKYTPLHLGVSFFKTITDSSQFFEGGYGYRLLLLKFIYVFIPVHVFISNLFGLTGIDFFVARFLKSLMFGLFTSLIFCFFYKVGDKPDVVNQGTFFQKLLKNSRLTIALLLLLYILILPEIWLLVLYFVDELLMNLILAIIPLALFFFYYNNPKIKDKKVLTTLFIMIVFTTYISNLIKHVGRINFLLIFLFLLFTDKKKILTWRYGALIFILLFLSFPLLGMFKIFAGVSPLDVIGVNEHMGIDEKGGVLSTVYEFLSTVHLSFLPHAFFLVLLFSFFLILHVYSCLKNIKPKSDPETNSLRDLVIFSFFWYLLTALSFFVGRGFVFDPKHHLRLEFSIFLVPQALFLISYSYYVYKKYFSAKKAKKIMHYLIYALILAALLHNTLRFNSWRGGWGSYFLGYDTARQYVDDHAENSVLLIVWDHSTPIYFSSSNNYSMVHDLTNSSILLSYQENYTAVFIADRWKLDFYDPSIVNLTLLPVNDGSPYGKLKKILGRDYPPIYLYTVQKE